MSADDPYEDGANPNIPSAFKPCNFRVETTPKNVIFWTHEFEFISRHNLSSEI